jgi:hypothetical protein
MIVTYFKEFVLNYMTNIRKIPVSSAKKIVIGRNNFTFFERLFEEIIRASLFKEKLICPFRAHHG